MVDSYRNTFGDNTPDAVAAFRLDVNLLKRIKFGERRALELRADAINFSNSPD